MIVKQHHIIADTPVSLNLHVRTRNRLPTFTSAQETLGLAEYQL